MNDSIVYALDFDGVICDSAIETGISGWKAACQIWNEMPKSVPIEMVEKFRRVRPIIETGYEAILTMRMLHLGESIETIYKNHTDQFQILMQEAQVDSNDLKQLFGDIRDNWIANENIDWIQQNPLYQGVAKKLISLSENNIWYVVTTKQERFVKMILDANHIELPDQRIYGLDRNLSKIQVLTKLQNEHPKQPIQFVEDRLPTLLKVRQVPELANIQLYFATWGYNSPEDENQALSEGLNVQQLDQFLCKDPATVN